MSAGPRPESNVTQSVPFLRVADRDSRRFS
jgi:hypothetical protein